LVEEVAEAAEAKELVKMGTNPASDRSMKMIIAM
jgi:hypothetical protein